MATDRFGNVIAAGLPYARGTILRSTEDDFTKLRHAWQLIQARIQKDGIDSVFNFNESPEVSQVPHAAVNSCANLIAFVKCLPGILLHLFHPQADTTGFGIDTEDFDFDRITRIDNLTRMLDTLRPAHFRNVDQTLHPILQLDKGAIVGHACDATINAGAYGEALFNT